MLAKQGILYSPDYVINAGGLINVYNEMIGYDEVKAFKQVHNIYDTLLAIFDIAKQEAITTNDAARQLAEDRIQSGRRTKTKAIAA